MLHYFNYLNITSLINAKFTSLIFSISPKVTTRTNWNHNEHLENKIKHAELIDIKSFVFVTVNLFLAF